MRRASLAPQIRKPKRKRTFVQFSLCVLYGLFEYLVIQQPTCLNTGSPRIAELTEERRSDPSDELERDIRTAIGCQVCVFICHLNCTEGDPYMSVSATFVVFLCIASLSFMLMTIRRFRQNNQQIAPARSSRLQRWKEKLKSPEWRQYGALLFLGKMAGLAILAAVVYYTNPGLLGHRVFAADATVKASDVVNPLNTVWTLVAAFLVFGMQVGFTMLEAGFCRSRETVNVLMECIVDTCLCGLLFYAIGFAFMFSHGNGFIGYHWFFLKGAPATYESSGVAFLGFWLFQFAFADTCSTITSGAMIGRTGFVGDLV